VWSADGLEPALESLAAARAALAAYLPQHGEETGYALEKLALAGQTARILADGGNLDEALQAVAGIAEQFRDLGHPRSARTAIALQAGVLLRLGRVEEALSQLTAIAEEALNAGESYEARERSAELARILDDLGRTDEAEAVWQRFAS
jgi:predicted negative regulator of RcsB-dependent stress response